MIQDKKLRGIVIDVPENKGSAIIIGLKNFPRLSVYIQNTILPSGFSDCFKSLNCF